MNTTFSDVIQYFKMLATQHESIRHSSAEKHFYRFEIEEVLSGLKTINYPALILEGYRFSLIDKQSDNVLKERTGAFILLDHLNSISDYDAMHELWDRLETICDDIIARIKSDKFSPSSTAVRDFDFNNIEFALIANENDKNYGIRCTFTIISPFSTALNPSKWNYNCDIP